MIAGKTGRHTYTEWDQVLMRRRRGAPGDEPLHHAGQRRVPHAPIPKDMCARSLDILNRTVMVADASRSTRQAEIDDIIHNIGVAARVALGGMPGRGGRRCATSRPVDAQKFDMKVEA